MAVTSTAQFNLTPASIKSIQRGVITFTAATTATATISAVDTTKSELRYLGMGNNSATFGTGTNKYIVLTNSSTITATSIGTATSGDIVSWELTEWN